MQEPKMQQTDDADELVSALADGELSEPELGQALARLASSPQAQAHWHSYHLVGDVLRAGAGTAVGAHDAAFMARLRLRLQQEGAPARPDAVIRRIAVQPSANDSLWRWKLVAGLSSLGAVALLGWQLTFPSQPAPQMADASPAQAVQAQAAASEPPVMIRDPRLDQLIAAHQQLGGTSALQMPAGFLRNATFERPSR